MVVGNCLRVACGPTAHPRTCRSSTSSSSRKGSSGSGVQRAPPLLFEQPGGSQALWSAVASGPPADASGPSSVLPLPIVSSVTTSCLSHLPWHSQQCERQHQQQQNMQQFQQRQPRRAQLPRSPSRVLPVRQLDVGLNKPPPRPPPPQQQQDGDEEREKDFFANVGDAIRTLREDYPLIFVKDLNYGIYRGDLVFKDPNLTFSGLRNYRVIIWSLRFHGRLFLKAAHVRVLRIWQPEDTVIKLRWQVNASPRVGSPGTFDGISIYRLDRSGRVYQHEVTDVQMRDPPITNPLLYGLNFILSPRPRIQQMPCPGSYFLDSEEDVLPDGHIVAPMLRFHCSQD